MGIMKKITLLVILQLGCLGMHVRAQTATDSVKAVIHQLFTAMIQAEEKALLDCFSDSAILQTITKAADGSFITQNESVAEFAAFIAKESKGNADERIQFETLKIDGPLAIAWTPYQFYYKGVFSHCGVNSFQCLRTNKGWKIIYLVDTRRRNGCK